jgi:hypothetical protein
MTHRAPLMRSFSIPREGAGPQPGEALSPATVDRGGPSGLLLRPPALVAWVHIPIDLACRLRLDSLGSGCDRTGLNCKEVQLQFRGKPPLGAT